MEEGLDLRDYINVLVKRKNLIVGITLVAVLISALLSYFVLPSVYKGNAIIIPAEISDKLIVSPQEIQTLIKSEEFAKIISSKINIPSELIMNSVTTSILSNTNLVSVSFEALDKITIENYFKYLLPTIIEFSGKYYNQKIGLLESRKSLITSSIDLLKKEEEEILKGLDQVKHGNYSIDYISLKYIYTSVLLQRLSLEQELSDIEAQLKASHNFEYLSPPTVLDKPVKPRKLFNIAVAGTAAFFFSILLAFFIEFWKGNSKAKTQGTA